MTLNPHLVQFISVNLILYSLFGKLCLFIFPGMRSMRVAKFQFLNEIFTSDLYNQSSNAFRNMYDKYDEKVCQQCITEIRNLTHNFYTPRYL